jgi:site-specific DNA-cytosine methylase
MGGANFIGHTNDGLKATCVIETMDKRLTQLLESGIEITDTCMLDTYNQQVQDNVSCTIRTNINTANHHFIMETETPLLVGNIYPNKSKSGRDMQAGRVYDKNAISPCLSQMEGGNTEPKIVSYTRSREDGSIQNRHLNDVANTIHGSTGQGGNTDSYVSEPSFRIRKLTERECFRLMGLADTDITKIQASGVSRSQQYKMAGNSIVVDVLFHIFRKLYIEPQCEHQQLTLF